MDGVFKYNISEQVCTQEKWKENIATQWWIEEHTFAFTFT